MIVRLNVSYAATDGSMPESVEIEWTDPSDQALTDMRAVVAHLVAAPVRRSGGWEAEAQWREALTTAATEPHCRRTVCGHPQALHTSADEAGVFIGPRQGMCSVCRNADKCRSFVGGVNEHE